MRLDDDILGRDEYQGSLDFFYKRYVDFFPAKVEKYGT